MRAESKFGLKVTLAVIAVFVVISLIVRPKPPGG